PMIRLEMLATFAQIGPPALAALGDDANKFLDELKDILNTFAGVDSTPPETTSGPLDMGMPPYGRDRPCHRHSRSYPHRPSGPYGPYAPTAEPGKPDGPRKPRDRAAEITRLLPAAAALALVELALDKSQSKEVLMVLAESLRLRNPEDPDPVEKELHERVRTA